MCEMRSRLSGCLLHGFLDEGNKRFEDFLLLGHIQLIPELKIRKSTAKPKASSEA